MQLGMETRRQSQIDNWHNQSVPIHGDILQAEAYKGKHPAAIHRPTPVCHTYNCHGLTFASRRAEIISSGEVRKILAHDDYEPVLNTSNILPGDIAIYISSENEIEHSGLVVEVPQFPGQLVVNPKILSKWGSAHEVIHLVKDCPYAESRVEYYRVMR